MGYSELCQTNILVRLWIITNFNVLSLAIFYELVRARTFERKVKETWSSVQIIGLDVGLDVPFDSVGQIHRKIADFGQNRSCDYFKHEHIRYI